MTSDDGALTRDAEVIDRLPRDPVPVVDWWVSRGQDRALTVRLRGQEVRAIAIEEYRYPDGRTAYRILPANNNDTPSIRVWWDDRAMRWGWLPAGRDAEQAGRWKDPKAVRRRHWSSASWPTIWVHIRGAWRQAWLHEREDWPDGTVVYQVGVEREDAEKTECLEQLRVVYDPRSVQARQYGVREDGSQA